MAHIDAMPSGVPLSETQGCRFSDGDLNTYAAVRSTCSMLTHAERKTGLPQQHRHIVDCVREDQLIHAG